MKTYILIRKFGIAVIVAKNPTEALEFLLSHEVDPYLTQGITQADLKEITPDTREGVVAYFAN